MNTSTAGIARDGPCRVAYVRLLMWKEIQDVSKERDFCGFVGCNDCGDEFLRTA
jgi:hypothetical protein